MKTFKTLAAVLCLTATTLAALPAQAAQSWNGQVWNGLNWNGQVWNGLSTNGQVWNGLSTNGQVWNGQVWNGQVWNGSNYNNDSGKDVMHVEIVAVTLPEAVGGKP